MLEIYLIMRLIIRGLYSTSAWTTIASLVVATLYLKLEIEYINLT